MKINNQKTKEIWQPFYEEELTDSDALEISNNLNGFFSVLAEEKKRQLELKNRRVNCG